MATRKSEEVINILPVEVQTRKITIEGISPLIVHAWSAKARREILEKEMNLTKVKGHDTKNPYADFASSMYWLTPQPDEFKKETIQAAIEGGARFGFPLTGIKQAACSAVYRAGIVKNQMEMRGAFFIEPSQDYYYGGDLELSKDKKRIDIVPNAMRREQMVEIICPEGPVMREDNVKVGMGSADIRYRGMFEEWSMDLAITYNASSRVTFEQIVNAINLGGFTVGIGEWRPEKDGQHGRFRVKTS